MAAIGAYTDPTWANGGTPAINATNLQAATTQIKNITDAAVSGGASPTKIWTSTNDGNSGQPPAPKPKAAAGVGQWRALTATTGNALSLPAGGTWAYFYTAVTTATGVMESAWYADAGTAGGTALGSAVAGREYRGFCWEIT